MNVIWLAALACSPLIALLVFCWTWYGLVYLLGVTATALLHVGFEEMILTLSGHWLLVLPRLVISQVALQTGYLLLDVQTAVSKWGCLQLERVSVWLGIKK